MKHHHSNRVDNAIVPKGRRIKPHGAAASGMLVKSYRLNILSLNGNQRSKLFGLLDYQNLDREILEYRGSAEGKDIPSFLRVSGDAEGIRRVAKLLEETAVVFEPYSELSIPRSFEDGNCELSAAGSGEMSSAHKRFRALNGCQRRESERNGHSADAADAAASKRRAQEIERAADNQILRGISALQVAASQGLEQFAAAIAHDAAIREMEIEPFAPLNGAIPAAPDIGKIGKIVSLPIDSRAHSAGYLETLELWRTLEQSQRDALRMKVSAGNIRENIPDDVFTQRDIDRLRFARQALAINRAYNCGIPAARAIARRLNRAK